MPGLYGVQIDVQRYWPAVVGVREDAGVERQHGIDELDPQRRAAGRAGGTSSGGRQNVIFDVPSACSAPVVMSKNAASSSALPAAVSLNTQYAVCVVVPVHDSASCVSGTGTPLTRAVPVGRAHVDLARHGHNRPAEVAPLVHSPARCR